MSDVKLYQIIEKYCSEIHKDGMCFVEPYNYSDFVTALDIRDCENGFEAFVSANGTLCFAIDSLEHFCDDFEELKKCILEKFAS